MSDHPPARHRSDPGVGRFLVPLALLAVVAVALFVAWFTWQQQRDRVPAASPAPAASTGAPTASASPSPSGSPSASGTPTSTPARTPTPSGSPSPSPSPTRPSPSPSPTRAPRSYKVVVYNATSTTGAAARLAAEARDAGWTVVEVANWTERPPSTTVYHPKGAEAAARALARDLGIDRLRTAYDALPAGRLVVVIG